MYGVEMTRIRQIKTNFTAGEVSRDLLGRGDLRAYENGALELRNMFIFPTGGITRRAGLGYIDTAAGDGRLVSFEFNTEQTYLMVVTNNQIDIYAGGVNVQTLFAPWTSVQIPQMTWTQSADTLLMVHPDVKPKKLLRNSLGTFVLQDWNFFIDGNVIQQPYYKFAESTVTLTPSATTGSITLTASASVFQSGHTGTRLRVAGNEVTITLVNSSTVVTATVIQTLSGTFAEQQNAGKAAAAHIQLLLKLTQWAGLESKVQENKDFSTFMARAKNEAESFEPSDQDLA